MQQYKPGWVQLAERMCRYTEPVNYDKAFAAVKTALGAAFWGPPASGVYSPSVQFTLFQMAKLALERHVPPFSERLTATHNLGRMLHIASSVMPLMCL